MKLPLKLTILGLFILVACNQQQTMQDKVESIFSVNPKLTKSDTDTLFIHTNKIEKNYLHHYDDKEGYSKLRNDTVMIFNGKGFFTGKSMLMSISKGTFAFSFHEYSCTYGHKYKTIEQKLTLNKDHYEVDDTIVGEMFFKSIYVLDSIKLITDTTVITGKFKFRVRYADYDNTTLRQERNYQEFIELSKNRPDTITSLQLSNCGLKKLPEKLLLFKNLTNLDLEDNDLSNADLSILASLTKMRTVSFSRCNLNEFPNVIFHFKQLHRLDLYNNNIKALPLGLFQMTSLRELQIGGNDYSFLPAEIGNLKNLEMLSLESTQVRSFPKSILKLTKLKVIYLPDKMDYFPPELAKCLSQSFSYTGITNLADFKDKIPKDQ